VTVYVSKALKERIDAVAENEHVAHSALLFASTLYIKAADSEKKLTPQKRFKAYFPLHSKLLRDIYTTRHYAPMQRLLAKVKAVEIKPNKGKKGKGGYEVGKKSKSYRLSLKFTTDVGPVEIDAPKLEARADAVYELSSTHAMSGPARQWIIGTYKNTSFSKRAKKVLEQHAFKTPDARHRAENHAANITAKRLRFNVADSGRIYYSVANLPKDMRGELRIDGRKTAEIDISCSQPSLLATLYKNGRPKHRAERLEYLKAILHPGFYESFGKQSGNNWTRDEAKTEFFNQIAFGSYYCRQKYALLKPFTERFPIIASLMAARKRKGNRVLPVEMQTLEARAVIEGACMECAEKHIQVLPVHDSLICQARYSRTVARIFLRHWKKETGLPVRLKISVKGQDTKVIESDDIAVFTGATN
jgi:hypothetical protein